jgi:hypothetical protein
MIRPTYIRTPPFYDVKKVLDESLGFILPDKAKRYDIHTSNRYVFKDPFQGLLDIVPHKEIIAVFSLTILYRYCNLPHSVFRPHHKPLPVVA